MKNRNERQQTAQETILILNEGHYCTTAGSTVSIQTALRRAVDGTKVIRPGDWRAVVRNATQMPPRAASAQVEVTDETTLGAARRLIQRESVQAVAALNFASAKNAGGGFLNGSLAQEESLAVASGLYQTLLVGEDYYTANRQCRSLLYTNHAIYSPEVPVLRDDGGQLLDEPYQVSFITMPAPNIGAMRAGDPDLDRVEDTLRLRIEYVLALTAAEGRTSVILGAWGCGVFRNDPRQLAGLFRGVLLGTGNWSHRFERIVFAIFDTSHDRHVLRAFETEFAQ